MIRLMNFDLDAGCRNSALALTRSLAALRTGRGPREVVV